MKRLIPTLLFLVLFLLPAAGLRAETRTADSPDFIRPPYLRTGDTVGLVSPAGKLHKKIDTARIRERIEAWGLHVRFGAFCANREEPYFAGTDRQRADDLQRMIDDPSVKAVIACRGGYGSVRLLPLVDLAGLRENPKWIVGFSDITTLHLVLRRMGIESIHGPMPSGFRIDEKEREPDERDISAESLRQALFGEIRRIEAEPHPLNCPGTARGRLAGGNLTVLCAANGTPEALDAATPTILFIEEIGEFAYRIDRMMQSLERNGTLRKVRAVLVGHLSKTIGCDKFGVPDAEAVIAPYVRDLGIPVIFGVAAGHEDPNLALYMGREVEVRVDGTGACIDFCPAAQSEE